MKFRDINSIYRRPTIIKNQEEILMDGWIKWFDGLTVNPLLSYFTQEDLNRLTYISNSPSLKTKPKEKFKLIGEIMRTRGFSLLGCGTNRRVYSCDYDDRIIAKVALSKVGFTNNITDFSNQNVLKPFCSKIFEVAPGGILSIIERGEPVKSEEDFASIGEEVFSILDAKLSNMEILMDDIGSRSFKNWGLRKNFGPIMIDFPTMFVSDPKKCFCNNVSSNGLICNGLIKYDEGFDSLVCQNCGKHHFARSLAKINGDDTSELLMAARITESDKIVRSCTKMKILVRRENGTKELIDLGKNGYNCVEKPDEYEDPFVTCKEKRKLRVYIPSNKELINIINKHGLHSDFVNIEELLKEETDSHDTDNTPVETKEDNSTPIETKTKEEVKEEKATEVVNNVTSSESDNKPKQPRPQHKSSNLKHNFDLAAKFADEHPDLIPTDKDSPQEITDKEKRRRKYYNKNKNTNKRWCNDNVDISNF